jgi:hypothetical protein
MKPPVQLIYANKTLKKKKKAKASEVGLFRSTPGLPLEGRYDYKSSTPLEFGVIM